MFASWSFAARLACGAEGVFGFALIAGVCIDLQCGTLGWAIAVLLTACCVWVAVRREWRSNSWRHVSGSLGCAGVARRWVLVVTWYDLVNGDNAIGQGFIHCGQVEVRRMPGGDARVMPPSVTLRRPGDEDSLEQSILTGY